MNRSTIVMVLALFGLIGVWALSGKDKTQERLEPIVFEGFLVKETSLQDIKILNKDEKSPYTEFRIERQTDAGPVSYAIKLDMKTANEAKASDKKWWVTRNLGGRTLRVKAENYRIRIYNQALARNFRSSFALRAKGAELTQYGLDPKNAIRVTAISPKQTVKWVIGSTFKLSEDSDATWVMKQGQDDVVYQVSGFDLRHHFKADWKDIRDRKILDVNLASITRVELSNPLDKESHSVVLTRPELTPEQKKSLQEGKEWSKVRKSSDNWTLVNANGLTLDEPELSGWLESLGRMTATEYVDLIDGKVPEDSGLDDPKEAIDVKLIAPDKSVHVRIGKLLPQGQEKDVYVQVVGRADEVYGVAGWMGGQIKATVKKLRDRRLTQSSKAAEAVALTIVTRGERFEAQKSGDTWRSPLAIDPNNVTDFLKSMDEVRVEWPEGMTVDKDVMSSKTSTIELRWADGKVRLLTVGEHSKRGDFAAWKGGEVMKVPEWNAGQLRKRGRDFLDKHIIQSPLGDITSLTLPGPKGPVTLTRNDKAAWVAAKGPSVDDKAVQTLLAQLVRSEYHAEEDISAAEAGLDPAAWTATVVARDGKQYELELSDKRKENNPYGRLRVNGKDPKIFTISAMMVEVFRKTIDQLKSSAGK